MKKHIFSIIITAVFGFSAQFAHAQVTDKEIKKTEKERQKLAEKQEKERLKKPAQIEIDGESQVISKLLVNYFKSQNYKIDQTGKKKIGMSRIYSEVNTQTSSGGRAERRVIISLDEVGGKIRVTINMGMLAPNAFGKISYVNLDSDPKTRSEIDALLLSLKQTVEGQNP
jgi:hypothetical protein